MIHFWKSYKVVKLEQEQTKTLNDPKTIKDIKLKWNAKSSTSGQIIFRLFSLHIYIFSYTCSVPFPYLSPNSLLKLFNSLVIAYAVLRGISMVIDFFLNLCYRYEVFSNTWSVSMFCQLSSTWFLVFISSLWRKCNREEQIWLHIGSISFTLTFLFYCFCYKLRMLPVAWNIQDNPFSRLWTLKV